MLDYEHTDSNRLAYSPTSEAVNEVSRFIATYLQEYFHRNVSTILETELLALEESIKRRIIENVNGSIHQIFEVLQNSMTQRNPTGHTPANTTADSSLNLMGAPSMPALFSGAHMMPQLTPVAWPDIQNTLSNFFVPPPHVPADSVPSTAPFSGNAPPAADSGYESMLRPSESNMTSFGSLPFDLDLDQIMQSLESDLGPSSSETQEAGPSTKRGRRM